MMLVKRAQDQNGNGKGFKFYCMMSDNMAVM